MKVILYAAILFFSSVGSAQILYVGDSHSAQPFGAELAKRLQRWGDHSLEVDRYAVAGSSVPSWNHDKICKPDGRCDYTYGYVTPQHPDGANSDEPRGVDGFAKLAHRTSYSAYVIALGTNDANNTSCTPVSENHGAPKGEGNAILKLLAQIPAGRPCVWVGPPSYTKGVIVKNCGGVTKFNAWVRSLKDLVTARGCHFVADPAEPSKGYHFNTAEGKAAADQVWNKIKSIKLPDRPNDAPSSRNKQLQ